MMLAMRLMGLRTMASWVVVAMVVMTGFVGETVGNDDGYDMICDNKTVIESLVCDPLTRYQVSLRLYYDLLQCSPSNYSAGCAAGFFEVPERLLEYNNGVSTRPCCPGFYCAQDAVCLIECSAGANCPSPATTDRGFCMPYRIPSRPDLGCGGAPFEFPCDEGSYCPTPSGLALKCPKGYYCPSGSNQPIKCSILAHCPEGSSIPEINFVGVFLLFGISSVIFLAVYFGKVIHTKRFEKNYSSWIKLDSNPELEMKLLHSGESEGSVTPSLIDPLNPTVYKISIDVQDFSVTAKGTKRLVLTSVNAKLNAGRMTAIIGPSGAGKTTFLWSIAGKRSDQTNGKIFINGQDSCVSEFKEVVGFTPQEDIMHRKLTVFENLAFNARWRLPRSYTDTQKMEIVFRVMKLLRLDKFELSGRIIGDAFSPSAISGGERKRVNIGMELVANPSILFLDEPTSGLDSTTTFDVIDVLRQVAASGVNVIVVLHQPRFEVMNMFDDLLLIAPGGRTAYMGPVNKALPYFESLGFTLPPLMNPADFYMDIVSGRFKPNNPNWNSENIDSGDSNATIQMESEAEEICNYVLREWKKVSREEAQDVPTNYQPYEKREQASFIQQLYYCTSRSLTLLARELDVLISDTVLMCLAGITLGILFRGVALTRVHVVNLFISITLGFTCIQSSLRIFGEEHEIFWRESGAGLSRIAYFTGKNISNSVSLFLHPFAFLAFFYFISCPRAPFVSYYLILLATQFTLSGIGQFISLVMKPAKSQLAAVIAVLIIHAISGFMPFLKEFGKFAFVCSFSYARWLLEALWLLETANYPNLFAPVKTELANKFSYSNGTERQRMEELHYCVMIILLQGVIVRVMTCIALFVANRDKQK